MCWEKVIEHFIQPHWVSAEEAEAQQTNGCGERFQSTCGEPGLESGTLVPVPSWVSTNSLSLQAFQDSLKGTESEWPQRGMPYLDHPNYF